MSSTLPQKMHMGMSGESYLQYHAERHRDSLCPLLGKVFGETVECTSVKVSLPTIELCHTATNLYCLTEVVLNSTNTV
jgi:hypothetical protein